MNATFGNYTNLDLPHELGGGEVFPDGIVFNFVISIILSNTPILAQTNRFVEVPFIKAELDKPPNTTPTDTKDQIAQNKGLSILGI